MSDPTQLSPDEIEELIDSAALRMKRAFTRKDQVEAWEDMRYWISLRSAETVETMERVKGLRK